MFLLLVLFLLTFTAYVSYKLSIRRYEACAKELPGDHFYTALGDIERVFKKKKSTKSANLLRLLAEAGWRYRELGIMRAWFGPFLFVFTWDPKYIEELATSPHLAKKGKILQYVIKPGCFKGIITNEGDHEWKELRRPLTLTMKKKYIDTRHHDLFLKHGMGFVEYLRGKSEVNILEQTNRVNMEIFGGSRYGSGIVSKFVDEIHSCVSKAIDEKWDVHDMKAMKDHCQTSQRSLDHQQTNFLNCGFFETHLGIDASDFKSWTPVIISFLDRFIEARIKDGFKLWPILMFWYKYITIPEIVKELDRCLDYVMNYRRKKMEVEGVNEEEEYQFYIDSMLRRAQRRKHGDDVAGGEILEVLIAGGETSSTTLSSVLVLLAMHPEIQEAAYQEQLKIFGEDTTATPVPEDLCKMELLDRIVKESLRLVAPPAINKQASEDTMLGEYKIPKGTYVFLFIHYLHRNPKYWEKPNDFYPDHFLPEKVQDRPNFAYIPFGVGPRRCPGELYAKASIATIISLLIRNFKFSSKYKYEDLRYMFSLMCKFKPHFYDVQIEERCRKEA